MTQQQIPNLNQIKQYQVNRPGQYEGIKQTLYDFQTYPAAGSTSLLFFQIPKGQSSKTIADTNMENAGMLPQPKHFLISSVEIHFFPGESIAGVNTTIGAPNFINDMWAVGKSGSLELKVGSKPYLEEAPLLRFPPKNRMEINAAAAIQKKQTTAADDEEMVTVEYGAWGGRPYFVDPYILLEPSQNFEVSLNWPTAVSTVGGVAGRIGIILDGWLYRKSQ